MKGFRVFPRLTATATLIPGARHPVGGDRSCPFTHAKRGIARLNRTSKLAKRENVCEAADNAERPRSPGPARAAARRQGPRTAANRTGSSNPVRFFCDIKDLLAEGREAGANLSLAAGRPISLLNREKQGIFAILGDLMEF